MPWVPLDPVGPGKLPSLEVIIGSGPVMRADYENRSHIDPHRSNDYADQISGERVILDLEPGDVALIDHYVLHRTDPRAAGNRTSAEFRFMPG